MATSRANDMSLKTIMKERGQRSALLVRMKIAVGILLACLAVQTAAADILDPKAIPPTRKKLSAPGQRVPEMTPEARQRMAEAMKRYWAGRGAKPKALKRGQPGSITRAPNR